MGRGQFYNFIIPDSYQLQLPSNKSSVTSSWFLEDNLIGDEFLYQSWGQSDKFNFKSS